MDRIDLHLEVPRVPYKELSEPGPGETSATMRQRALKAREIQQGRFEKLRIHSNARMATRHIRQHCRLDRESTALLEKAMERFALSARAHSRILKIARTIADLACSAEIRTPHVAEAIQYRTLDRKVQR